MFYPGCIGIEYSRVKRSRHQLPESFKLSGSFFVESFREVFVLNYFTARITSRLYLGPGCFSMVNPAAFKLRCI